MSIPIMPTTHTIIRCRLLSTLLILTFFTTSILAKAIEPLPYYTVGDPIPISCLNRTIETGEHITNEKGELQYIPFPKCNETGRPLELNFGIEKEINCTIDFIDDSFFHLLEFYVHNDAPLTCRIPSLPMTPEDAPTLHDTDDQIGVLGTQNSHYIPLIIALTGILQLSHLHVANNLNILLHAAPKATSPGIIDSATAYSTSHLTKNTKVVIGDSLPLRFSVRWYPTTSLPSGWTGVGGHLFLSTVIYCLLSALAATAVCIAYFRGIELPRRLKTHGRDRAFGLQRANSNGAGSWGYTKGD